jgi:hypothetical protein
MPNIELAQIMLDCLKRDFKDAWDKHQRMDNISLPDYSKRFGVSPEDIEAYCATLTPLKPIYPFCVVCACEWRGSEKKIKPIHNGHIIDFVDSFILFCCGGGGVADHDAIWYHQRKDGTCSFNMEVDDLHGRDYEVRWNCHCMVKKCYGKTVIVNHNEEEYHILKECQDLPFTVSRDELYQLIQQG